MAKSTDPRGLVRMMYQESIDTFRDRFMGSRSDDWYMALGGEEEGGRTPVLPPDANGAKPSSLRARVFGEHPKDVVRRVLWFVLPSFVARALGHVDEDGAIPAANSTSYLNGLRGLAALFVAIAHDTDDYLWVHHGWGQTAEDYSLVQLPFIRVVFSGTYMVTIFFVISGFALTYSPLKKCHAGQSADAIASLPSSIFRRAFRLFMPVVPILAATLVLIHYQAFYSPPGRGPHGQVANGLWSQVTFLWRTLVTIMTTSTTATIMPQGWTLSVEYQGSLLVFLCCAAFARTSALVRILCVLVLLTFFLHRSMWQECLFLAGMILGDLRHVRQNLSPSKGRTRQVVTAASWLLLVFALFLGGWPGRENGYTAAGYSWFALVPTLGIAPERFFPSIAAISLIVALENLPDLQRGLSSPWVLYLGEISYGLYLVHWLVGRSFLTWGLKYQMLDAGYSMGFAWSVTFVIMLVLSIWISDIHWRLVDQKSVRFAHWLSKKLGI